MLTVIGRRVFATCLLALGIAARVAAAPPEEPIVFGGEASYPPFEWLKNGQPTGFNVELGRAVATTGGRRAEHRLGSWPDAIRNLQSGAVDVVAMFRSDEREQDFLFTKPFTFVNHAIYGLEDARSVGSIDDLGQAVVAVERLSYAHLRLRETDDPAHVVPLESTVAALQSVVQRRADYAILSAPAAEYLIASRNLPLEAAGPPLWPAEYAFAVRKDREELATWLDARLGEVVASGTYGEIRARWRGRMTPAGTAGKFLPIAAALFGAVVLVGGWWLLSVRRTARQSAARLTAESRRRLDAERRLSWAADHNPETGMPNQHRFLRLAAQHLAKHDRGELKHVVVAAKLAEFEQTVRTYGHDAGLGLLQSFAHRIRNAGFPAHGQIGRDVIVVFGEKAAVDGEFRAPSGRDDAADLRPPGPRVFAGAATWPQHGTSLPELLRKAETALSVAIERREEWVEFRPAMEPDASDLELVAAFREHGSTLIYPVFQPQVDLLTGEVVAAEALARWALTPQVPPNVFVPLLERAGLIARVTRRMVAEGMRVAAGLRRMGHRCPVSVNVTGKDMLGWKLSRSIVKAARKHDGATSDLKLELTETSVVDRPELLQWKMRRLVKEGLTISVDDFGTGYSSLTYLSHFPVREIKIDRSFVRDMTRNDRHMRIVTSTIAMGHELGLIVVAEGVETEETLNALRRAGCDRAQGYAISRPLAEADLFEFLPRRAEPVCTPRASVTPIRGGT